MNSRMRLARLMAVIVAAALLGACGGGGGSGGGGSGGGGGGGGGGGSAEMVVTPATVSATAVINDAVDPARGLLPNGTLSVQLSNIPANAQAIRGQYSNAGVLSIELTFTTPAAAMLSVILRPPAQLAPGAYTDHVTLQACTDSSCNNRISGSDVTLTINYTVTAPAAGHDPAIRFDQAAIDVRALTIDGSSAGPQSTLGFTLTNFGAQPYVHVDHPSNAVQMINTNTGNTTHGSLDLYFSAPSTLGTGVHSDPFTITVCLDSNCANPVAGSPFTIPVTYTIGDTIVIPGAGGYTLRAVQIEATGWAWDHTHGRLLVATQYDSNLHSYALAMDPATGTVGTQTLLDGFATAAIAISDDGQYLYVGLTNGTVERLSLPGLQRDLIIPLDRDPYGNQFQVRQIQVQPGAAHTIAAALDSSGQQVAIFDDDVMRPSVLFNPFNAPAGSVARNLRWGTAPGVLYGVGYATAGAWNFYTMSVDATGITGQTTQGDLADPSGTGNSPDILHPGGGLLYTESGYAIDPASGSVAKILNTDPRFYALQTDDSLGRVFTVGSSNFGMVAELRSLSLADSTELAHATLPQFISTLPNSLVRWGSDGLVYGTGSGGYTNFMVFVNGPLVAP